MSEIKLTTEEYNNLLGIAYFCKHNIDDISTTLEITKGRLQILVDELNKIEKIKSDKILNR